MKNVLVLFGSESDEYIYTDIITELKTHFSVRFEVISAHRDPVKLIDILKVANITESAYIEREIALIKVKAQGEQREEVKRTADIFRGQIVDVTASLYTIQMVGTSDKIDAFIHAIGDTTKVIEISRSGVVGLARGEKSMKA